MCGIFGAVGDNAGVACEIVLGLFDLQHRGQQACGVATSDGPNLNCHCQEGLVTEVFGEGGRDGLFKKLSGSFGIGHTLYSTIGRGGERKQPKTFQPLVGNFHGQPFALGHNGNLIRLKALRKEAKLLGYEFRSRASDTEVIVALLSTSKETNFLEALKKVLPRLEGAFALTILFGDKVIGVRDRNGIRPLCVGRNETGFFLASESCAFYTLGASFIREVQPGEVIILGRGGIERSFLWSKNVQLKFCIFELVYFARPDSYFCGRSVYSYRNNAGTILAGEQPVDADIVVPVPESGRIYDDSFAAALGLPVREGLFRNRHMSARTFLAPRHTNRLHLQRRKIHPLEDVVRGQKVCNTEDSIIRANVSPAIIAMQREAGATQVHLRVFSAPIRYPCFLGIDMADKRELVAAHRTVEQIEKKIIFADSLGYLSLDGMVRATGLPKESLCLGCFTGEYPISPP